MSEKNITPAILGASFELARNSVTFTPDDLIAQIDRFHGVEVTSEDISLFLVDPKNRWLTSSSTSEEKLIRRKANGSLVTPLRGTSPLDRWILSGRQL